MMRMAISQRATLTLATAICWVAVATTTATAQSRRVQEAPPERPNPTAEMEQLRAELRAEIDARIERSMNALRSELATMIDEAVGEQGGGSAPEARRADGRMGLGAGQQGGMRRPLRIEGEGIDRDQLMKLLREGGVTAEGLPSGMAVRGAPAQQGRGAGYLGVSIGTSDDLGVDVLGVNAGTAAEKAGLREGDRIVAIDDVEMVDVQTLAAYVSSRSPGDSIEMLLVREGEETIVEAVLGQRPNAIGQAQGGGQARRMQPGIVLPTPPAPRPADEAVAVPSMPSMPSPDESAEAQEGARPWLGVTIQNSEGGSAPGIDVVGVAEGSPAAESGIREGDRIIAIDGVRVSDVDALADAIFSKGLGKKATIVLSRGSDTRIVMVPLMARDEASNAGADAASATVGDSADDADSSDDSGNREEARADARPGFLGVYLADGEGGAAVTDTIEDTAAASAGMKAGDVITSVNNQSVSGSNDLVETLRSFREGDSITLTIRRGGSAMNKTVTLGSRPASLDQTASSMPMEEIESIEAESVEEEEIAEAGEVEEIVEEEEVESSGRGYLGVEIGDLDAQSRAVLGLDEDEGILVTRVIEETPAAMAGLRTNDVLVSANSKAIGSRDALVSVLGETGAGGTLKLSILRKGRAMELPVTLGSR